MPVRCEGCNSEAPSHFHLLICLGDDTMIADLDVTMSEQLRDVGAAAFLFALGAVGLK